MGKELGLPTGKYVSPNGHVGGRNWISKDLHGPEEGSEHTPYEKGDPTMPEKHSSFFALLTTAAPDPRNAIRNGPEHGSEHAPYENGDPRMTETKHPSLFSYLKTAAPDPARSGICCSAPFPGESMQIARPRSELHSIPIWESLCSADRGLAICILSPGNAGPGAPYATHDASAVAPAPCAIQAVPTHYYRSSGTVVVL